MIKNLRKNKKGFTLIEIIVVLVILAVLMALAVPSVMKYIDEANNAKYLTDARAVYQAADVEIAKDYADNKALDGSTWGTFDSFHELLTDATGVDCSGVVPVTDGGAVVAFDDADDTQITDPKVVNKYQITLTEGSTKVQITRNGTAEVVDAFD